MGSPKTLRELDALRGLALEDLLAASEAELRSEAFQASEDISLVAAKVQEGMRTASAAVLRRKLQKAKERRPIGSSQIQYILRPTLDEIKRIVKELFDVDPGLRLAFREGVKQTDEDWMSLYDDLVAMGAIQSDRHAN